jgi:hypothetical protein
LKRIILLGNSMPSDPVMKLLSGMESAEVRVSRVHTLDKVMEYLNEAGEFIVVVDLESDLGQNRTEILTRIRAKKKKTPVLLLSNRMIPRNTWRAEGFYECYEYGTPRDGLEAALRKAIGR